jgi:hypothetical protein
MREETAQGAARQQILGDAAEDSFARTGAPIGAGHHQIDPLILREAEQRGRYGLLDRDTVGPAQERKGIPGGRRASRTSFHATAMGFAGSLLTPGGTTSTGRPADSRTAPVSTKRLGSRRIPTRWPR